MSEMVRRVAAALEATHDNALCWEHMAQVAILAMREPTSDMRWAAASLAASRPKQATFRETGFLAAAFAKLILSGYRAMIDAALADAREHSSPRQVLQPIRDEPLLSTGGGESSSREPSPSIRGVVRGGTEP